MLLIITCHRINKKQVYKNMQVLLRSKLVAIPGNFLIFIQSENILVMFVCLLTMRNYKLFNKMFM